MIYIYIYNIQHLICQYVLPSQLPARFLELASERLLLLLGEDDLHIDREEVVFEALRRWALARSPTPEEWMAGGLST